MEWQCQAWFAFSHILRLGDPYSTLSYNSTGRLFQSAVGSDSVPSGFYSGCPSATVLLHYKQRINKLLQLVNIYFTQRAWVNK